LHPPPQEAVGDGAAVDGHVHRLSHPLVHEGHFGVQLLRGQKVQPAEVPLMLDRRQFAGENLHALGQRVLLQGAIDIGDMDLFGQQGRQAGDALRHPAEL
jgi:hypothetical protein